MGRVPAVIHRCEFKIADKDILPEQPDYAGSLDLSCVATLPAGEPFDTSEVGPSPANGTKNGQPIMFVFFGRLTYRELNGKVHHTGYAVEVSPHMAAFSPHNNNAYDYYD